VAQGGGAYSFDLVDLHEPRHTIVTAGLADLSQIANDAVGVVDATACQVRMPDCFDQARIFFRAFRYRLKQFYVPNVVLYYRAKLHPK
jgi:hypothetical protein